MAKKKFKPFAAPRVFNPNPPGQIGQLLDLLCDNPKCQQKVTLWVKRGWWLGPQAECNLCGHNMCCAPESVNITIVARGPGAHDGTIGDRKKRIMRERSQRLEKTQWDNMPSITPGEGRKARNPTKDGPLDPSGRFGKSVAAKTTFVGNKSVESKGNKPRKSKP